MKLKKIIAIGLALTMVMSQCLTVSAAPRLSTWKILSAVILAVSGAEIIYTEKDVLLEKTTLSTECNGKGMINGKLYGNIPEGITCKNKFNVYTYGNKGLDDGREFFEPTYMYKTNVNLPY